MPAAPLPVSQRVSCIVVTVLGVLAFGIGENGACAHAQPDARTQNSSPPDTASAEPLTRAERWRQKRRVKAQQLAPPEPSFFQRARRFVAETGGAVVPHRFILNVPELEVAGVHPVLGGLGGNAGLGGGLLYEPPILRGKQRFARVEALASIRRYYQLESVTGIEWEQYLTYGFGRYQHRPNETFYGVGPEPDPDDGATYRLDQGLLGGLFGRSFSDQILLGGHVSYQINRFGRGRGRLPQMSEQFPTLPGAGSDADYLMIGAFFEYDSRNTPYDRAFGRRFAPTEQRLRRVSLEAQRGFYLAAEVTQNLDTRANEFDFTRYTLDIREFLPVDQELMHGFAFRQFASVTQSPDGQVPFYRLQALGGSRSLRGYDSGQFRGRNVLLSNVEVRCQVWHWLDMALFTDVGQVFQRVQDAQFTDPHVGYGLGFRIKKDGQTLGRLDVARSEEGITTHLDLGSLF
jgi:Surface antigen.